MPKGEPKYMHDAQATFEVADDVLAVHVRLARVHGNSADNNHDPLRAGVAGGEVE